MERDFEVVYAEDVVREDIPALSSVARSRVRRAIESKLTTEPEIYGKPLRRSLRGYRSLRVGEYRVVFRITGNVDKVLLIAHRRTVYQVADKRLA